MAVPKKKTARSRSKTRHSAYVKKQQKKLLNFVERAKRNARGKARVTKRAATVTKKKVTKIAA